MVHLYARSLQDYIKQLIELKYEKNEAFRIYQGFSNCLRYAEEVDDCSQKPMEVESFEEIFPEMADEDETYS